VLISALLASTCRGAQQYENTFRVRVRVRRFGGGRLPNVV
jgi:hypothetical protein